VSLARSTRRTIGGAGIDAPCALLACILVLGPAARVARADDCGRLDGDRFRYPERDVVSRTVVGSFAIPAGVAGWDARDWAMFGGFATATVALVLPTDPSPDVRIQRWVDDHQSSGADRFFLHIMSIPMAVGFVGYTTLMAGLAYAFDRPDLREYTSLMVEAVGITQFYHLTAKLLLGREGPYQGDGTGRFYGPTQVHLPGGTPSGHTATVYAMLATAAEYYDSWALRLLTHLVGIYVGASLIYHDQHYLSDVVWGAGMGYFVARWVVRHHASTHRCGEPVEPDALIAPWASRQGGGLVLSVTF